VIGKATFYDKTILYLKVLKTACHTTTNLLVVFFFIVTIEVTAESLLGELDGIAVYQHLGVVVMLVLLSSSQIKHIIIISKIHQ
jgi:hypothetical protein